MAVDVYKRVFHPGSTQEPLVQAVIVPLDGVVGDWVAHFQMRQSDDDAVPTLAVIGTIEQKAAASLDAAITAEFPGVDPLWQVTVRASSAATQDLRGIFGFGLDLTKGSDPTLAPPAYENVPLFDQATISFGTDFSR